MCLVSETDGYPHVVCSKCLVKLTDFELFKECCQKSIIKYDNMFVSRKNLEENKPEVDVGDGGSGLELCEQDPLGETSPDVTIKSEEVIIDSSSYEFSEDPLVETEVSCGPILLKYEVLPFSSDSRPQDNVDPLNLEPEEGDIDSTEVEPLLAETVTHPKYPHSLENNRPHFTSKGGNEADSCSWSISTNDKLMFEKITNLSLSLDVGASYSGTTDRLEMQRILPEESIDMVPFYQQEKERVMMVQDIGRDGDACRGSSQEMEARERREGLKCYHCGIVLMSKLGLTLHMKVHGFVDSYESAESNKNFHFNGQLKRHRLADTGCKPHICAECSKSFNNSSNVKTHMRLHTGSKPYKCTLCSKTFSLNGNLKTHMRSHTGSKPYKCADCSKSFSQNGSLKRHMTTHTGSKPYKCADCSKSFRHTSDLNTHMRLHSGTKQYVCTECSKCFSQNGSLERHMRIHTGYKQYICTECSKCFSQISNLKTHMRLHTGSKPYKCSECSKTFSLNGNLKKHMILHTGSKR